MLFCVYKMMSESQVADNDTYGLLVRRTFTILHKIHITTFGEVLKA